MWDFETLSLKYTVTQLNKLRNHQPCYKNCPICDEVFDAQSYMFRPTAIYPRINATCSDACKRIFGGRKNKKVFKDYVCEGCNQPFVPHKSKPHQRFCKKLCRGILLRGATRPEVQRWIHKITPPKGSISNWGTLWLDEHVVPLREHLIQIDGKNYRVDGFNPSTNTIYEYLGSFWHGNPAVYDSNDMNPVNKKTFGMLYQETQRRLELFEQAGYNVIIEWSSR